MRGYAGTGKTSIMAALVQAMKELKQHIVLLAPTGRAAKRMSEATSEEAKTIHRMLEMDYKADEGPVFRRDESSLLEEDVIIVDEASMIDLYLMEALLRAMRPGTRLILIGDANQLPPVGAGCIFKDIITSERFSAVELTHIFRQAEESLIVMNAHAINKGEMPELGVKDNDFFSMFKLRGSVGNPGNQNFSAYQAFSTYKFNGWMTNVFGAGVILNALGNTNLA